MSLVFSMWGRERQSFKKKKGANSLMRCHVPSTCAFHLVPKVVLWCWVDWPFSVSSDPLAWLLLQLVIFRMSLYFEIWPVHKIHINSEQKKKNGLLKVIVVKIQLVRTNLSSERAESVISCQLAHKWITWMGPLSVWGIKWSCLGIHHHINCMRFCSKRFDVGQRRWNLTVIYSILLILYKMVRIRP